MEWMVGSMTDLNLFCGPNPTLVLQIQLITLIVIKLYRDKLTFQAEGVLKQLW